jgi:hypothetical protein
MESKLVQGVYISLENSYDVEPTLRRVNCCDSPGVPAVRRDRPTGSARIGGIRICVISVASRWTDVRRGEKSTMASGWRRLGLYLCRYRRDLPHAGGVACRQGEAPGTRCQRPSPPRCGRGYPACVTAATGVQHMYLGSEDVTESPSPAEISIYASPVSAIPAVRRFC